MVALTISSPRDAYAELRARTLVLLLITLPYTVLVAVTTAAVIGDRVVLPGVMGLSLALLGAMPATGAWASASAMYPCSFPQEGAFTSTVPGQAGLAWISMAGGMLVTALLAAPVIALTVRLHMPGRHGWLWLVLPVGAVYGATLGWLGLRAAAFRTAHRLPEILAAVSRG